MAQYTVYRNIDGAGYLLDVQSDIISHFSTRVVVPLVAQDEIPDYAKTLNPVFEIEGELVVMATQGLAAVPGQILNPCSTTPAISPCHNPEIFPIFSSVLYYPGTFSCC